MKIISIIIPCYNEESNLHSLYETLSSLINSQQNYQWQILMIDDGRKDNTLQILQQIRKEDHRFF